MVAAIHGCSRLGTRLVLLVLMIAWFDWTMPILYGATGLPQQETPAAQDGDAAKSAEPDVLGKILSAQQKRQRQVKTAKFVWTEKRSYPRRSNLDDDGANTWPPEDTAVRSRYTIYIDGEKLRYDRQGMTRNVTLQRFREVTSIAASNALVSKHLIASGSGAPSGVIYRESGCMGAGTADVAPVVRTFRPSHYLLGKDPRQWSVRESREEVDQHECIVMDKKDRTYQSSYWFAPAQDYSFVRFCWRQEGRLVTQIDVTHRQDPVHGWIPAKWRLAVDNVQGSVATSASAEVTEYTINSPLDPKTFDIVFPAGTKVHDMRTDVYYVEGE